jgi:hypothetical protein
MGSPVQVKLLKDVLSFSTCCSSTAAKLPEAVTYLQKHFYFIYLVHLRSRAAATVWQVARSGNQSYKCKILLPGVFRLKGLSCPPPDLTMGAG